MVRNKQVFDSKTEYPLVIKITKDRKRSYIYTGYKVLQSQWDEKAQLVHKSHPNAARYNNFIRKKLSEATDASLDLETAKKDVTTSAIKRQIRPKYKSLFFAQADLYLANLKKAGKRNQYNSEKPRINAFKAFMGNTDIAFSEINPTLLKRFKADLKYDKNNKVRSDRTVVNHLVPIRTIFNLAIQAGIVEAKYYPFGKGKLVIKFPESIKIGLEMEEIRRIEELSLPEGSQSNHARNVWLFTFYIAGMRISDALRLKWSDIHDDRLVYQMGKNSKVDSLKLPEKAVAILAQYKRENPVHDLVFPDLETIIDMDDSFEVQNRIAQKAKRINELLPAIATECDIKKKITNHISRHSFGNISGDRISLQMLQKLYRHTSITTTINYQGNFIHKDADEALEAVLS
ncbi:MAG: site-specific integrase [Sediminibacterium sp.]